MKIIINTILILFIMYILLESCTITKEYNINLNLERMANVDDTDGTDGSEHERLDIHTSNFKEENEIEELRDYVRGNIMPDGFYETDANDANFKSNLVDPADYYQDEDTDLLKNHIKSITGIAKEPKPSRQFNAPAEPHLTKPQMWNYKDESMMNGGQVIPGVSGFDNNIDIFAKFDDHSMTQKVSDGDLRFGKPIYNK